MQLFARLGIVLVVLVTCVAHDARAKIVYERIFILPAGAVDEGKVKYIARELPDMLELDANAKVEPGRDLPAAAFDESRGQYDAIALIDKIARTYRLSLTGERAIIIVDADIFVPGSEYVFGYADPQKGFAVVSLYRLRPEFAGGKPDDRLFRQRVLKEAFCQLGRSRGIVPCSRPRCVMGPTTDAKSLDGKKMNACLDCQKKLRLLYTKPMFKTPLF